MATASRLEVFGPVVGYHNRNERDDVPYDYYPTPAALARASDVLVVTASGGLGSRRLVDGEVLRALGASGFLINVGRGSIIDEVALANALADHTIAGAGIDTFNDEPHVPAALTSLSNVVLLPHIASGTHQTRAAMKELVLENMAQFLSFGQLTTPIAAHVAPTTKS